MAVDPRQAESLDSIAEEFLAALRRGQAQSIEEYAACYPDLADELREVLPMVMMLENVKQETGSHAAPPASPVVPKQLGDFRLLRELGRGGMGIVYEAEQQSLGRRVAVKVLASSFTGDAKALQRFQREARTAARLHHTNIVPVFGVGKQDGLHFYVMQMIEGAGLDELVRNLTPERTILLSHSAADAARETVAVGGSVSRLSDRIAAGLASGVFLPGHVERAEPAEQTPTAVAGLTAAAASPGSKYWRSIAWLGVQAAEALHYAHSQGVLHRDIKPSNLLLDARGGLWIADFGLAKALEDNQLSRTGDVVGTFHYMAPEQLAGKPEPRSDLYGLGLTLYELSIFGSAFTEAFSCRNWLMKGHGWLPSPRLSRPEIPRDLETIILKAAAHEPAARYSNAGDLAADLRRFLEDRPVRARRAGMIEHAARWCRRNPLPAALSAAVALLLMLVVGVTAWSYAQNSQALARELTERKRAEDTLALSLEVLDGLYERFASDSALEGSTLSGSGAANAHGRPAISPETAQILEELLTFYDRIAGSTGDDSRLTAEIAKANRRLGDIHQRLGNLDQAEEAYRRSLARYRAAVALMSAEALALETSRVENELGRLLWARGHIAEAREAHKNVLARLEKSPQNSSLIVEAARTCSFLSLQPPPTPFGGPADNAQELESEWLAETYRTQAVKLLESLPERERDAPSIRRLLAHCYLQERPTPDSPFSAGNTQGVEMLERLVEEFPLAADLRHDLAQAYAGMDVRRLASKWMRPSLDRLEKGEKLAAALVEKHPQVPAYVETLAHVELRRARVLRYFQQEDDAERCYQRAIELQQMMVQRFPQSSLQHAWLATMRDLYSKQLMERHQMREADQMLTLAVTDLEQLPEDLRKEGTDSGKVLDYLKRMKREMRPPPPGPRDGPPGRPPRPEGGPLGGPPGGPPGGPGGGPGGPGNRPPPPGPPR